MRTRLNIAVLTFEKGDLKFTASQLIALLRDLKEVVGNDHGTTLLTYHNLGAAYLQARMFPQAESYLEFAYTKCRKLLGPAHWQTLLSLDGLIKVHVAQERFADAEPLALYFYQIVERWDDFEKRKQRLTSARSTYRIADVIRKQGGLTLLSRKRFSFAEPSLRALAARYRDFPSTKHPWIGTYIRGALGACLSGEREFEEAEPLLLDAYENLKDQEAPITEIDRVGQIVQHIVWMYEGWNKPKEAERWRDVQLEWRDNRAEAYLAWIHGTPQGDLGREERAKIFREVACKDGIVERVTERLTDPKHAWYFHNIWVQRAKALIQNGKWKQARAAYEKVDINRLIKHNHSDAYCLAALQLLTEDRGAYQSTFERMIDTFDPDSKPNHGWLLARTAGICPEKPVANEQIQTWAKAGTKIETEYSYPPHGEALAALRAGNFARVIEKAQESNAGQWHEGAKAQNWLVMAIAAQKQGDVDAAQNYLKEARSRIKAKSAYERARILKHAEDMVATALLLREAEQLIPRKAQTQQSMK